MLDNNTTTRVVIDLPNDLLNFIKDMGDDEKPPIPVEKVIESVLSYLP